MVIAVPTPAVRVSDTVSLQIRHCAPRRFTVPSRAALAAFQAGKSDAHIDDDPVIAYLARALGGGNSFEVGRQAISHRRVRHRRVIAGGTYDKILAKWGLTLGALHSAPIDAGKFFTN